MQASEKEMDSYKKLDHVKFIQKRDNIQDKYNLFTQVTPSMPYLQIFKDDYVSVSFLNGRIMPEMEKTTNLSVLDLGFGSLFFPNINILYKGDDSTGKETLAKFLFEKIFDDRYTTFDNNIASAEEQNVLQRYLLPNIDKESFEQFHNAKEKYISLEERCVEGYEKNPQIIGTLNNTSALKEFDDKRFKEDMLKEFILIDFPNNIHERYSNIHLKEPKYEKNLTKKNNNMDETKYMCEDMFACICDLSYDLLDSSKELLNFMPEILSVDIAEIVSKNIDILRALDQMPNFALYNTKFYNDLSEQQKNLNMKFNFHDRKKLADLSHMISFLVDLKNGEYSSKQRYETDLEHVVAATGIMIENQLLFNIENEKQREDYMHIPNHVVHAYMETSDDLNKVKGLENVDMKRSGIFKGIYNEAMEIGLEKGYDAYISLLEESLHYLNNPVYYDPIRLALQTNIVTDVASMIEYSNRNKDEIAEILETSCNLHVTNQNFNTMYKHADIKDFFFVTQLSKYMDKTSGNYQVIRPERIQSLSKSN